MKKRLQARLNDPIRQLLAFVMLVMCLLALAPEPAHADNQGLPQTIDVLTNQPATVAASVSATNHSIVQVRKGQGMGVSWKFNASGSATSDTLWIYPIIDGTNTTTLKPWIWTVSGGAADQTDYTNWSAATLNGIWGLDFLVHSNAHGTQTFTNKGFIFNRPNN